MLGSWCDSGKCDDVVRREFLLKSFRSNGHCEGTKCMNPRQKVEETLNRGDVMADNKVEVVEGWMADVEDGCDEMG